MNTLGIHTISRADDTTDVFVDGVEIGYIWQRECAHAGYFVEAHTRHPDGGWIVTEHDDHHEALAAVITRDAQPVAA